MGIRFGVIGFGNMGSAIVDGFVAKNVFASSEIGIYDVYIGAREKASKSGYAIFDTPHALVKECEVILVGVKPAQAEVLFSEIGHDLEGKLVISIVAGITNARINSYAGMDIDVLRVMPNTPALVGAGAFALDSDSLLDTDRKEEIFSWFQRIGETFWVEEKLFSVVTALSGGGPAYTAIFIEALADAGVLHGLKRDIAYRLVSQTVLGSAKQVLETKIHPGALKDMVCSPAGTTIEGVYALERGGFRASVIDAIHTATEKADRL